MHLTAGHTRSCGCLNQNKLSLKPKKIYRRHENPIYHAWRDMKTRCTNKKREGYKNYGGRGITYCDEWEYFDNFNRDMGSSYKFGRQLDRINNNKGYYKKNCRWATSKENNNNRRNNIKDKQHD
jgi:hypothetical protein